MIDDETQAEAEAVVKELRAREAQWRAMRDEAIAAREGLLKAIADVEKQYREEKRELRLHSWIGLAFVTFALIFLVIQFWLRFTEGAPQW